MKIDVCHDMYGIVYFSCDGYLILNVVGLYIVCVYPQTRKL